MEKFKLLVNKKKINNDIAKYGITENYPVTLQVTYNIRALRHLYILRTSPRALKEFQTFASLLIDTLLLKYPEYNIIFEDLRS
jgi:thymidylate synthase ThyX